MKFIMRFNLIKEIKLVDFINSEFFTTLHLHIVIQAGSSTMFDYFFFLTNFTSLPLERQTFIRKSVFSQIVPYFRKIQKPVAIAKQVATEHLFPIAVVRHPFQRFESLK
jgi:hypothetical protein